MQPLIMMFVLFMSYGVVYNTIQCHWHPMIVDRVIDGDTVAQLAPMLPVPLNITGLHLRIRGVDCAETGGAPAVIRNQNWGRLQRCSRSMPFIHNHHTPQCKHSSVDGLRTGIVACTYNPNAAADKYGGRILGDLKLWNDSGEETLLSERLLESHHARPYSGRGARKGWCEEEEDNTELAVVDNAVCQRQFTCGQHDKKEKCNGSH